MKKPTGTGNAGGERLPRKTKGTTGSRRKKARIAPRVKASRAFSGFIQMYLRTEDLLGAFRKHIDPNGQKPDDVALAEARRLLRTEAGKALLEAARLNKERMAARAVTDKINRENKRKGLEGKDRLMMVDAKAAIADYALNKAVLANKLFALASVSMKDVAKWNKDGVEVLDSETLSDAVAYGVVEVKHDGKRVSIKIADRRQAIVDLAALMGMRAEDDRPPPAEADARRSQFRTQIMDMLADLAQNKPLVIDQKANEAQVVPEAPEEEKSEWPT